MRVAVSSHNPDAHPTLPHENAGQVALRTLIFESRQPIRAVDVPLTRG
jgi:hypothetical protein